MNEYKKIKTQKRKARECRQQARYYGGIDSRGSRIKEGLPIAGRHREA
jgi:hypothetical protein